MLKNKINHEIESLKKEIQSFYKNSPEETKSYSNKQIEFLQKIKDNLNKTHPHLKIPKQEFEKISLSVVQNFKRSFEEMKENIKELTKGK